MYGTVGRFRVQPGLEQRFEQVASEVESVPVDGLVATHIYRMDADPREFYMAVLFESKESYFANAHSPEQHARYLRLRALLEGDPEWHDGAIIFSTQPANQPKGK